MPDIFEKGRAVRSPWHPNRVNSRAPRSAGVTSGEAAHWHLPRSSKYAGYGVARVVPPGETVRRMTRFMDRIGVTRVGEVTGLDRVGLPNFMSVRPRDLGPGISYYNGKGTTRAEAHAGALMEAIERYSGERWDGPVVVGRYDDVRRHGAAVDPRELIVPCVREYEPEMVLEWVQGYDLVAGQPTAVPLNSVICPYAPAARRASALYYASTNGLASGNTLVEALCHALCEVIERDAEAMAMAELELKPTIGRVLTDLGRAPPPGPAAGPRFSRIAPEGLPVRAARVVGKFRRAGLSVVLRDLTCTAGIPTLDCSITERQADGNYLIHGGCGTHPDARVALLRALTEAAQSRVACIQGGREDLPEFFRPGGSPRIPEVLREDSPLRPFHAVASRSFPRVDQDVRFLLRRMRHAGFSSVVAVDLTRSDLGVPVVRAVVPRAETWSIFHQHTARGVFGPRVAELLRRGNP